MMNEILEYLNKQFTVNQFAIAGLLTTVLYAIGSYIKGAPAYLWSRFHRLFHFSVEIPEIGDLHRVISIAMSIKYQGKIKTAEAFIDQNGKPSFMQMHDHMNVWYKGRYLRIGSTKEKLEGADMAYSSYTKSLHISGLFAKKQIAQFIDEMYETGHVLVEEAKSRKTEIFLLTKDQWGADIRIGPMLRPKTIDMLYLDPKLRADLIQDLDKFKTSREYYKESRIPYKRGYAFTGPPGNGKTSIGLAIAEYLKYDVMELNLEMNSQEFKLLTSRIPKKTVIMIDDYDSFYNGREPKSDKIVPFATLLGFLSGPTTKDDHIVVITTNIPESLDPAILRRGRIDFIREIGNPSGMIVDTYISNVFATNFTNNSGKPYKNLCFSEVQEIVMSSASTKEAFDKLIIH